ncbi:MAG: multidrug effflux MFS transporter [Rhodobacteraceae bacterium]|nr:multidrug effflux MFS transporter [Paracoccaceae bacterium]
MADRGRPQASAPSRIEFIALMAMMVAVIAFSLDAMLPALPQIAASLSPDAPDRVQLLVPSFVLGLGLGTLTVGPMADRFGRKPVLLVLVAVYCAGAALAWRAQSLDLLLAARVLQGLGAAGPRVVAMTVVRDRYVGREMAQIMSFIMMVFALVPAIAPALGAALIALAGWRSVFVSFAVFALTSGLWFMLRQPETLAPADRLPLDMRRLARAAKEILSHRVMQRSILVQILIYGMLFGNLSTVQPVMDQIFHRGDSFPLWFALIALFGSAGGFINSRLVMRLGMRRMIVRALICQFVVSLAYLACDFVGLGTGALGFAAFFVWTMSVFLLVGFTLGNLNALALEPLGHLAGTATSVMTAIATVGAAVIAVPVSLAFDGTSPHPVALVLLCYVTPAMLLMRGMPREAPRPT